MELNLKRPIVFIDLETTGLNIATDRIIEIAALKIEPKGTKTQFVEVVNPGIPILPQSTAFHGFKDSDVQDKPSFKEIAPRLLDFIKGCDFGGYNSNKFDIPLLAEEVLRAGFEFDMKNRNMVDVQNIFYRMEQRTLKAAYKFYCNKTLRNAHSALADIEATYEIMKAQVERYQNADFEDLFGNISQPIINDIKRLSEFTNFHRSADLAGQIIYNEKGEEVFNFGKYKGRGVEETFEKEPQYYDWIMNADFPLYTKKVFHTIKLRKLTNK
jgi:DNA polymerase III subunit epsilon